MYKEYINQIIKKGVIKMDEDKEVEEEKKDLEVLNGDGTELEISEVYEHIKGTEPKFEEIKDKSKIIIPKTKKEENK